MIKVIHITLVITCPLYFEDHGKRVYSKYSKHGVQKGNFECQLLTRVCTHSEIRDMKLLRNLNLFFVYKWRNKVCWSMRDHYWLKIQHLIQRTSFSQSFWQVLVWIWSHNVSSNGISLLSQEVPGIAWLCSAFKNTNVIFNKFSCIKLSFHSFHKQNGITYWTADRVVVRGY